MRLFEPDSSNHDWNQKNRTRFFVLDLASLNYTRLFIPDLDLVYTTINWFFWFLFQMTSTITRNIRYGENRVIYMLCFSSTVQSNIVSMSSEQNATGVSFNLERLCKEGPGLFKMIKCFKIKASLNRHSLFEIFSDAKLDDKGLTFMKFSELFTLFRHCLNNSV